MSVYPIITVAASGRVGDEPMGTKAKFWWRDQAGTTWLFKYARPGTGEHWAEKIAAEVGVALGVPCAEVELAECEEPGSVSRTFASGGSVVLVHGNELLQEIDSSYPIRQLRGVSKHTVPSVLDRLEPMLPPAASDEMPSAADWFVGYLISTHSSSTATGTTRTGVCCSCLAPKSSAGSPPVTITPRASVASSSTARAGPDWRTAVIEPTNPADPRARLLMVGRAAIGYVPSYLLADLDALETRSAGPTFVAERINLPPHPAHHRLHARLEADWPEGFKPLDTPELRGYQADALEPTG